MEILNKITMKGICGELKGLLGTKEAMDIVQVIGYVTGEVKGDKPTMYGDNIWLTGEFKAKNLLTNASYYAPKLYPPNTMHNILSAQLKGMEQPKIQFAFVIGLKKDDKARDGYAYTTRSLIEPEEDNDPFALIENRIKGIGHVAQAQPAQPAQAPGTTKNPGGVNEPGDIQFEN